MSSKTTKAIPSATPSHDAVLQLVGVSKWYTLYDNPRARLKQWLAGHRRQFFRPHVALENVSLTVQRGEVIGIVGQNGAGKSTLLQLICGTLTPSTGHVSLKGRVAALLELGAGFNPEFTGRENVWLSGALMGIERDTLARHFDEIVSFADIGDFIDQPVRTYSSGMFIRLAFAVATQVAPDILVIDEALSVGDGDFSRRSFQRILSLRDSGTTIIFCSHALYQVEMLCERALWLDHGQIRADGPADSVIPAYQAYLDALAHQQEQAEHLALSAPGHSAIEQARLLSVKASLATPEGDAESLNTSTDSSIHLHALSQCSTLVVDIQFKASQQHPQPNLAITFHTQEGLLISSCGSWEDGAQLILDSDGQGRCQIEFEQLPLLKGEYHVGVLLLCEQGMQLLDQQDPVAHLSVRQKGHMRGFFQLPHQWSAPAEDQFPSQDQEVTPHGADAEAPVPCLPTDQHHLMTQGWAKIQDVSTLCALFENSFNEPTQADFWHWKYARQAELGSLLRNSRQQPVAFCGMQGRQIMLRGTAAKAVQLVDVMVNPEIRGSLGKDGPFYQVVHPALKERVGFNKAYQLMFGFPHARTARLGIRLKLYRQVDHIQHLQWHAQRCSFGEKLRFGIRAAHYGDRLAADHLWQQMSQQLNEAVIGVRDGAWLIQRYWRQPNNTYQTWMVYCRLSGRAKGLIITKPTAADSWEILDIIAPPEDIPTLVNRLSEVAHAHQIQYLWAWATPFLIEQTKLHQMANVECHETDILVAGSAVQPEEEARQAADRWWLMGGDTDFH